MGVTHSMDEGQVSRISNALKGSACAIQGINSKFDAVEEHYRKLQVFHTRMNKQVEGGLDACERLDDTLYDRLETTLNTMEGAAQEFTMALEGITAALQSFDIKREVSHLPTALVPLMIPLVILLIELAVANAYLGILLASMPEVREKYSWCSSYLLANASCVLFGLTLSLVWLGGYRIWLTFHSKKRALEHQEGILSLEARDVQLRRELSDQSLGGELRREGSASSNASQYGSGEISASASKHLDDEVSARAGTSYSLRRVSGDSPPLLLPSREVSVRSADSVRRRRELERRIGARAQGAQDARLSGPVPSRQRSTLESGPSLARSRSAGSSMGRPGSPSRAMTDRAATDWQQSANDNSAQRHRTRASADSAMVSTPPSPAGASARASAMSESGSPSKPRERSPASGPPSPVTVAARPLSPASGPEQAGRPTVPASAPAPAQQRGGTKPQVSGWNPFNMSMTWRRDGDG